MVKISRCQESYYVEDTKKLLKYCEDCCYCEWGVNGRKKMMCGDRVKYLIYTYRNPVRVSKLTDVERSMYVLP